MNNCPKCNAEIDKPSKYCPACGAKLVEERIDSAWIAGMQEEIKKASSNGKWMLLPFFMGFFLVVAAIIYSPFTSGMLLGHLIFIPLGVIIMIFSAAMGIHYSNKSKKLVRQLKEGKRNLR